MGRLSKPLEMVSVRIYAGDKERLQKMYPSVPHNRAIREIVHKHLNRVEALYQEQVGGETDVEVEIDESTERDKPQEP